MLQEFFLPAVARLSTLIRSHGVDTILLRQRANLTDTLDLYRDCGINGLFGVCDANGMHLDRLIERYGDEMCYIGGIDGRVLRESEPEIESEVTNKVDLARKGRIIPCMGTHVLPEIEFDTYRYYAECLGRAVGI
jgi:uroporphyrinogen-III decarboxylase